MSLSTRAALRSVVVAGLVPVALALANPANAQNRSSGGGPAQEQLRNGGNTAEQRPGSEATRDTYSSAHRSAVSIGDELGAAGTSARHHERTTDSEAAGARPERPPATAEHHDHSRTAGASAGRVDLGPVGRVTSNSADYTSTQHHTFAEENGDDISGSRVVHESRRSTDNRATSHSVQLGPVNGRLNTAHSAQSQSAQSQSAQSTLRNSADGAAEHSDTSIPDRSASTGAAGNFSAALGVDTLASVDAHAAHVHQHDIEAGDDIESRYQSQHRLELSAAALGIALLDLN